MTTSTPIVELNIFSETVLLRASTGNLRSRLVVALEDSVNPEDDDADEEEDAAMNLLAETIGACIASGRYKVVEDAYLGRYSVTLHPAARVF